MRDIRNILRMLEYDPTKVDTYEIRELRYHVEELESHIRQLEDELATERRRHQEARSDRWSGSW
jgi:polyhydroxyalkanoate synthesis regulator phasin